ncbi:MAG: hypothetical protein EZS28_016477 [Streblomastix strix]|uniref:Uncharacterized protein n=1 Tax=Streblomastix strix TaxID=222440 RepID=A0A5J4VZK3_9EUKA|nr:MAG: hypothetical protein EZS28_016477 [Streblomastix strix]
MDTWNVNGKGQFDAQSFGAKLARLGANYEAQQTEFSAMCLFKDMYDKSSAVQVAVSGQLNTLDCEFQGTYLLDNYTNESASNEASNEAAYESFIDEFMINDFFPSSAYNTFYIVDDDTCRVCMFNLHFESKCFQGRTQEVGRFPESLKLADGKTVGIFSKIKQLTYKVEKDLQWANDSVYNSFIKPFAKPLLGAFCAGCQAIGKGLDVARTIEEILLENAVVPFTHDGDHYSMRKIKPESQMPALFDKEIIISLSDTDHDITQVQDSFFSVLLTTNILLDDKFDKIDESYKIGLVLFISLKSACGIYINMRDIEELIGYQMAIPYTIPIHFRICIPFDEENPIISMTKYYTMNKDEPLSSSQQKLIDIDLMIRNWSLTFKYSKQFIQLGFTADLITGLHVEPLIVSGLKNLVSNIKPVIMSIKNYFITEVTANMAGYKATDACLNRVRQFYSQRPFVVPAQRVEVQLLQTSASQTGIRTTQKIPLSHVTDFCLPFPKDARATTCFENFCYQNMQVTTCGRNFLDMSMNTHDQQFFQLQLNASNVDLLFEALDEYEDELTTPRNTAARRLNPHTDLTSFLITFQCESNSNGALTFDGQDTQN